MISGLYDTQLASTNYKSLKSIDCSTTNYRKNQNWTTITEKSPLNPHQRHYFFGEQIKSSGPFTHIKVTIYPDGGVSRLRVYGYIKDPSTFVKVPDMHAHLSNAALNDDLQELAKLVQVCKVDINCVDVDGRTALHVASTKGKFKSVQWLVGLGADYKLKDRSGNAPIDDARKAGKNDIVTFLEKNPYPETVKNDAGLRKLSNLRL